MSTPPPQPDPHADALARARDLLATARHVCVLTGAGISAESGIPTFRSSMNALWKDFDPATLATPQAFAADPERVTRWYDHRRLGCLAAQPNPAHLALATLERRLRARNADFTLLTQNVDGLHRRAGSTNLHELHGSILSWRCTVTARSIDPPPTPFERFPPPSPFDPAGLLRPNVVWFGEMLPEDALIAADEAARTCDVMLVVGTAAEVFPAAGFIELAARHGARVIEVNPEATAFSRFADAKLRGKAGELLPEMVG